MDAHTQSPVEPLTALRALEHGVVVRLDDRGESIGDAKDSTIARRLLELGFVPGATIEIVATMWPGGDPMAVRVGGSTFALRRHEAQVVQIRRSTAAPGWIDGRRGD